LPSKKAKPSNTKNNKRKQIKVSHVDPFAEREAKNYEHPIPSREHMLDIIQNHSGPVTHEQMCEILGIDTEDGIEGVRRRLIAMSRDGQILSNRRGAFGAIDKMNLVRGRIQGHKDGFGFLIDPQAEDDVYLSNRQMRQVFDGDEAVVRINNNRDFRGRREGTIVEVLNRNTKQLVGRLFSESGIHFVRPDNPRMTHDVLVTRDKLKGAKRGDYVVVAITQQPDRNNLPTGEISEVLGEHLAPGMEIDVAIRSHDIPNVWPSAVLAEAEQLPDQVDDIDKRKRIDLRKLPFVTIDGEDARDFDDAVYAEAKKSGGWRLFVAIADVSHYVSPGSALDVEAINRGNSVYFPDFVVPMLPEALSNGLCSLNPKVDRLVMVCEMTISAAGKVSGYKFFEGVIHSHERLTYTKVGQIIEERGDRDSGIRKQYHHVLEALDTLYELYRSLRQERSKRGAIDFETVETRILFDSNRKIERIVPVHRNEAHKLIEECMLCANVCAAKMLDKAGIEALYRVHEGPSGDKLENLRSFLGELGLSMRGKGQPTPAAYQSVLKMIGERPDAHLIQTVMLRSMSQAKYQPDNQGHFGLAYSAYTHFTSPIRRYPDLLVHRAIRYLLRGGAEAVDLQTSVAGNLQPVKGARKLKRAQIYPYDMNAILQMGEQCSLTERRADDATREVVSWLKCEYLSDRVGEVFAGVVSAVTNFGLFVELKDLYVEGLIHVTALPSDYYHYDQAQHRLVGERTRTVFRLGDELTVAVVNVNLDERKIDFELRETKAKKSKVSAKAKLMAQMHEDERVRRAGGKTGSKASSSTAPRKRPVKKSDAAPLDSRELKRNLISAAQKGEPENKKKTAASKVNSKTKPKISKVNGPSKSPSKSKSPKKNNKKKH